jgi:hypothetical protein
MPTENRDGFEIEYDGVELTETPGWAAQVKIIGPSTNPMHRSVVFEQQRVALESVFPSREEARKQALAIALDMLETH